MFSSYAKATVSAVVAALAVAGTAAVDNSISLQEGIYIASAFLIAFGSVWATPNQP